MKTSVWSTCLSALLMKVTLTNNQNSTYYECEGVCLSHIRAYLSHMFELNVICIVMEMLELHFAKKLYRTTVTLTSLKIHVKWMYTHEISDANQLVNALWKTSKSQKTIISYFENINDCTAHARLTVQIIIIWHVKIRIQIHSTNEHSDLKWENTLNVRC